MRNFAKSILTLSALTIGLTGSAAAYTSHVSYPNQTPYGAPTGTVEFRNHGNLTADIYVDGGYLGQVNPGDRVVVHDVWAGDTSVRWEYTWNYDGQSQNFYLNDCGRYVWDIYPRQTYTPNPPACGTTPVYNRPVYNPYGFSLRDDDFFIGLGQGGIHLDFD